MDRLVRQTLYQDRENSIRVSLERYTSQASPATMHASQIERQRQILGQRLRAVVLQLNRNLRGLPEQPSRPKTVSPGATDTLTALRPISDDIVYLKLLPAPNGPEASSPDPSGLFTLLAGVIGDGTSGLISCEIRASGSMITFQVGIQAELAPIIQQQLYALYPSALILPATNRPTQISHHRAGATLTFTPAEKHLRLEPNPTTDPLHAILEVLAGLGPAEQVSIQLLIGPLEANRSILRRAAAFIGESLRERFRGTDTPVDDETSDKTAEAIGRANLRIWAEAESPTRAKRLLDQVIAPYHQWTASDGAQLQRHLLPRSAAAANGHQLQVAPLQEKHAFLVTAGELASLYHLPQNPRVFPKLEALSSVHLPPPRQGPVASGLRIGQARYRDQQLPIVIAPEDRLRHLYLIGQTGTGKSSLFQSLFLQDVLAGEGCCYIDPHGEVIDWLLSRVPKARLNDVILFDPSRQEMLLGLNLLQWRTADERDLLIQELILLFYKLFDPDRSGIIGPQFEHWLRSAALTVTEPAIRGTLADIPRLFTDQAYQRWAIARVRHPSAKNFWRDQMTQTANFHKSEMLNYFVSKFGAFLGNATMRTILSQKHSAFDVRTIMDRRKILLVNLSKGKIGDLNAQLLGTLLTTKVQMAALSRADVPTDQRPPFYVYIDEFHTVATESFVSLLSEIRKYGVGLHLTHQYINQLSPKLKDAVIGNVGTLLALRVGQEDAAWLAPHFHPLTADDLMNIAAFHLHCKTLRQGSLSTPFTVEAIHTQAPVFPQTEKFIRTRMEAAAIVAALAQLPPARTAKPN